MNCRELRSYFEAHPGLHDCANNGIEVKEHIADCANCRQFVQMRKEIVTSLGLLHETAAPIPASLDATVLATYRRQIAMRQAVATSRSHFGFPRWPWVVVAATVVTVATVFVLEKPSVTVRVEPRKMQDRGVAHLPQLAPREVPPPEPVRKVAVATRKPKSTKLQVAAVDHGSPAVPQNELNDSLPSGFRSLMYCDELSCDGGMEVLRVQLPSPAPGFLPGSGSSNRVISADVLVGADGFARGIRIVQQKD